jgi:hypothetical protein
MMMRRAPAARPWRAEGLAGVWSKGGPGREQGSLQDPPTHYGGTLGLRVRGEGESGVPAEQPVEQRMDEGE